MKVFYFCFVYVVYALKSRDYCLAYRQTMKQIVERATQHGIHYERSGGRREAPTIFENEWRFKFDLVNAQSSAAAIKTQIALARPQNARAIYKTPEPLSRAGSAHPIYSHIYFAQFAVWSKTRIRAISLPNDTEKRNENIKSAINYSIFKTNTFYNVLFFKYKTFVERTNISKLHCAQIKCRWQNSDWRSVLLQCPLLSRYVGELSEKWTNAIANIRNPRLPTLPKL